MPRACLALCFIHILCLKCLWIMYWTSMLNPTVLNTSEQLQTISDIYWDLLDLQNYILCHWRHHISLDTQKKRMRKFIHYSKCWADGTTICSLLKWLCVVCQKYIEQTNVSIQDLDVILIQNSCCCLCVQNYVLCRFWHFKKHCYKLEVHNYVFYVFKRRPANSMVSCILLYCVLLCK